MSGSVIVAGARTPMGRLLGSLKGFSAAELGGIAIKGALEKAGVSGDQVQYVIMGHVIQAGAGQITARQAALAGGIPLDVPGPDHQQGVPVGHRRDRPGRPADPRRRVRRRRGRWHGVDDQRPARAGGQPRGRQVRRLDDEGLDGPRRAVLRHRRPGDGPVDRATTTPATTSPARSRTSSRRARTSWPRVRPRTGCSTTRSCRCRSRSARATRSSSAWTRACAPTPPSSRWLGCARRSPRTAPSRRAPPRRSPTVPLPWS